MRLAALLAISTVLIYASDIWSKDPAEWTQKDAERVLAASPWAQTVMVSIAGKDELENGDSGPLPGPAQAGMAGSQGVTDGRWDGGVGRKISTEVPSIPVTIRWDSAPRIHAAFMRLEALDPASGLEYPYTAQQLEKDYIVSVTGLVPAHQYRSVGRLDTTSQSEDTNGVDARDPEALLEGFMADSLLIPRGQKPIKAEDAKLDAATGTVRLFFPRSIPILASDKEVLFRTRFGSITVEKRFRLKDMTYRGQLDI